LKGGVDATIVVKLPNDEEIVDWKHHPYSDPGRLSGFCSFVNPTAPAYGGAAGCGSDADASPNLYTHTNPDPGDYSHGFTGYAYAHSGPGY
jgi:hypothetical protein